MKFYTALVLVLSSLSSISEGSIYVLPRNKRYVIQNKKDEKKVSAKKTEKRSKVRPIKKKKTKKVNKAEQRLKNKIEQLEKALNTRMAIPEVWEAPIKINKGDMIAGILRMSILSTNIESPIQVVNLQSDFFPVDSRIICSGTTKHKRVQVTCNTLVTSTYEADIEVVLLEPDGTLGLVGDLIEGKENYIAGVGAMEAIKGIVALKQATSITSLGAELVRPTPKNQLLQAAFNTTNKASELMEEELKTKEPKIFVKKDKKVLVYFSKTLEIKGFQ